MNLRSFVEPEKFPLLLKTLLDLYNHEIKKKVSLIVISGKTRTGKSTLKRFMIDLARSRHSVIGHILVEDLLGCVSNYNLHRTSLKGIDGYVCHAQVNNFTDKGIIKTHETINAGITYRERYKGAHTVCNPATLILDIEGNYQSNLKISTGLENQRNFIIFYLPYQKVYRLNETEILHACKREFDATIKFLEIKKMWILFKLLIDNLEFNLSDVFNSLSVILASGIDVSIFDDRYITMLCDGQF